ncbi:hypothetical protein AJ79_03944 [Helicocarpus griseus UAMH5409]|uniref:Xylanolytic transcriptional activator regulatory domain-containing protein n=1 Tax=Helicocarpus griseus UAMH5409 TaxID=1447875 RepID=A0A2B7XW29_9EURO|nr:hypothetical protein AJ79_03944 [Helicocarpus griseus UAMH5409]
MLRFIPRDDDGLPHKRRQSQRACARCRKSKKRCLHTQTPSSSRVSSLRGIDVQNEELESTTYSHGIRDSIQPGPASQTSPGGNVINATVRANSEHLSLADHETAGTAIINAGNVSGVQSEDDDEARFVGDLNPEGVFLAAASPDSTSCSSKCGVGVWLSRKAMTGAKRNLSHTEAEEPPPVSTHTHPNPLTSGITRPCLEDQCLRLLPNPRDVASLSTIYFEEVHPLLPVLDKDMYLSLALHSPAKVLLTQAICLASSATKKSKGFYNLAGERVPSREKFTGQLSSAIKTALELKIVKDKIILIQVLALLSFFTQLSGDSHSSAELTYRTVSYSHTTGLHLQIQTDRADQKYTSRLFCCVWALDRLNAAFHGRPVIMHERDCGRDMETCIREQEGCFQLFLRIVLLLDNVIALYRPSSAKAGKDWDHDFPTFEDLLQISGAASVSSPLLATVETLYHAVAMLGCRSQSLKEAAQSSTSYLRQCLSAIRVVSLVGEEFRDQLSPFPIVPYAISLALRIFYRDLRLSKAPITRARSRKQLLIACGILRDLGESYSSALMLVKLAEQTVREMDKICSSMNAVQRNGAPATNTTLRGESAIGASTSVDRTSQDEAENRSVERPQSDNASGLQYQDGTDAGTIDPSLFDNVPADLDVFAHFDPDFNLGAIDAALGDNINPSFPMDLDFIYPAG